MIVRTGEITKLSTLSQEERNRRVLSTDKWLTGEGSYIGVGTACCVLLAAHNAITRKGLLGDFSAIAGDWGKRLRPEYPTLYEGMDRFLEAVHAIPALGALANTTVWLGGTCAEWDNVRYDDTDFERAYALQKVNELAEPGYTVLEPHWTNIPNGVLKAQLDCPEGVLTIQTEIERGFIK